MGGGGGDNTEIVGEEDNTAIVKTKSMGKSLAKRNDNGD